MNVVNAVVPTGEQLQALVAEAGDDRPIVMLNLLRFRDQADYGGRDEPPATGREAYRRYGERMLSFVTAKGGRLLFSGRARDIVIGTVDEQWDAVALVEYPSRRAFLEIALSPEVAAFHHHRVAGLAGQLLILVEEGAGA